MPIDSQFEPPPAVKRASRRLLGVFLLAVVILLATLLGRPRPSLPFDTLHPHTQRVFRQLGIAPTRVTQGLGQLPASAGIHSADGVVDGRPYCAAFDLSVSDLTPGQTRALLHRLREAGFVCWWRIPGVSFPRTVADGVETGPHIHGIDPFIPHKPRLEMQIRDYEAGNNGIEIGPYAHRPDPPAACPQTRTERRLLRRHLAYDKPALAGGGNPVGYVEHAVRRSGLTDEKELSVLQWGHKTGFGRGTDLSPRPGIRQKSSVKHPLLLT